MHFNCENLLNRQGSSCWTTHKHQLSFECYCLRRPATKYAIETIAVAVWLTVLALCGYTAIASFIIIISIRSIVFVFISNCFFSFSFYAISFYIGISLTIAQTTNCIAFERFFVSLGVYDSYDGVRMHRITISRLSVIEYMTLYFFFEFQLLCIRIWLFFCSFHSNRNSLAIRIKIQASLK